MEYQKIKNLLDDTINQPSKFRKRDWVEINGESNGRYNNSNIRWSFDPFTNYITEINNAQVDDAYKIYVVMPMYNLIEHSDAYSNTLGRLWQYYRDETASDNNWNIIGFSHDNNNSTWFKFKQKITGQTENSGIHDVQIIVPLNYLSNFWRTPEMPLINCEIILQLKWSRNCIIEVGMVNNKNTTYQINDIKHYVPVVTLSTQENIKLRKQLEYCFKRKINWNIYLAK